MPPPSRGDQVLSKPPKLAEDARVDARLKTKLQFEASLEANRILTLPIIASEDMKTQLSNSLDQSTDYNERTLLYYTEMDEALDAELRGMDESLARCREIEAKLLEDNEPDTEEGELARILRRTKCSNKLFKGFRTVFRLYVDSLSETQPRMNIAGVLNALSKKMLTEPNDPYVDMDEIECDPKTFGFLLRYNLVQRHREEPRKMRLLDPRTN